MHWRTLGVGILWLTACRGGGIESANPPPAADTIILSELVREISDRATVRVSFDSRPLVFDLAEDMPSEAFYLEVGADLVDERRGLLDRLGMVAEAMFPMRANCTGMNVPPGFRDIGGCTDDVHRVIAFSLARPGGGSCVIVRRIELGYGPAGKVATVWETRLTRDGDTWRIVSDEPITIHG